MDEEHFAEKLLRGPSVPACLLLGFGHGFSMLRNQITAFGAVAFLVWFASAAQAQVNNPPALSVRAFDNQSVRLAWPKTATDFVLEATDQLGSPLVWQSVTEPPVPGGEEFSVTVAAGGVARFFRLQLVGAPDGDDDDDGLLNGNELARGTNPVLADTDGDGWSDGVEVADATDPLNPSSTPRNYFVGRPPLDVVLPSFDEIGTTGISITMGSPGVELVFPSVDEVDSTSGVTMGRPTLDVVFPAFDEIDATGGPTIGGPPVEVVFPSLDEVDSTSGVTIGRPPLEVVFPAVDEVDSILTGITLGRPPVSFRYVP